MIRTKDLRFNRTKASAHAQTDVFKNFNIEVTAGDSANNVSKSELNHSTSTTGTAQIKVTGISTDVETIHLAQPI